MALKLNTSLKTEHGMDVPNSYVRVTAVDGPSGEKLLIALEYYFNENAYDSNLLAIQPVGVTSGLEIVYDRAKDGVDTLAFAHQKAVEYFAQQGIDATILLDSLI